MMEIKETDIFLASSEGTRVPQNILFRENGCWGVIIDTPYSVGDENLTRQFEEGVRDADKMNRVCGAPHIHRFLDQREQARENPEP